MKIDSSNELKNPISSVSEEDLLLDVFLLLSDNSVGAVSKQSDRVSLAFANGQHFEIFIKQLI